MRIIISAIYVNSTPIYVTQTMRGKQTNRRTTIRQIEHISANHTFFADRTKDRSKSGNHIDHSRAEGISMLELPYTFLRLMHYFYFYRLREWAIH